jgi:folate-binding protein YgfZ
MALGVAKPCGDRYECAVRPLAGSASRIPLAPVLSRVSGTGWVVTAVADLLISYVTGVFPPGSTERAIITDMGVNVLRAGQGVQPACGPDAIADLAREYRALRSGAGVRLLDQRLIVRVTGDDRISFLHGMCTADIKGLKPGEVVRALFLTEHAHVIAEFFAYAAADGGILIEIDRELWPQVRDHLERFLVADDVEMNELGGLAVLDIEGPKSLEVAGRIWGKVAASLEPWRYAQEVRIANLPRFGQPAFTVIIEESQAAELVARILGQGPADGVYPVSALALEILRIENGLARVGVDTGEKTIALEAGLEPAISFSKGCYVGQETIERATARGGLRKRLYGLKIDGGRLPETGAAIMLEGKEVGRLSSVGSSPALGVIGLAILHHSAWSEGARVVVSNTAGESGAIVSNLPFKV